MRDRLLIILSALLIISMTFNVGLFEKSYDYRIELSHMHSVQCQTEIMVDSLIMDYMKLENDWYNENMYKWVYKKLLVEEYLDGDWDALIDEEYTIFPTYKRYLEGKN